jgi:hypothetical protein
VNQAMDMVMRVARAGKVARSIAIAASLVAGQAAAQVVSNSGDPSAASRNAAALSLQMLPDTNVDVGVKITFVATAKKPGYLLLLDIDATGKMSQIFPTPEMIVQSEEAAINFVKPGDRLTIPNLMARKSGFEYVVTPPVGQAAVVAILSERRVQILDLPDELQKPHATADVISDLSRWTSALRVPDPDTGKLQPSRWSFDIHSYFIK